MNLSRIGLGCATFGREIDEEMTFRVLDYALENGITFLATAEGYGGGNAQAYRRTQLHIEDVRETSSEMHSSELIIGRWFQSRGTRGTVTLSSKVSSGNSPENIQQAVAGSLDRLGVDSIDLYMVHSPDPKVPFEETLDALNREVEAGRVKAIGCSNHSGEQLKEALAISRKNGWARYEAIENNYNKIYREAETDVFPICEAETVSFIGYSPLGAGFLTGKYSPDPNQLPKGTRFDVIPGHVDVYFSDKAFQIVEALKTESETTGVSMVQLAARWALRHPTVHCTLFGARKVEHLDNALTALAAG